MFVYFLIQFLAINFFLLFNPVFSDFEGLLKCKNMQLNFGLQTVNSFISDIYLKSRMIFRRF